MSKKELLNETQIRRFMKLANIESLTKNVVSEMAQKPVKEEAEVKEEAMDPMAAPPAPEMDALPAGPDMGGDMEGGEAVEVGGDVDPEKKAAFEAAVQALADSMGIEVELESQEEQGAEGGEEMHDLGDLEGGEESGEGEEMGGEEGEEEAGEEDEEEMQEAQVEETEKLSEDELVEAVLKRVTARLVAEAKKKKMSVKQKMKAKKEEKKEEKKKEKVDEATDAKGGGPLLSKGGNKHDTFKGHADMKMGKGEKGGSGGHKMEDVSAKSEHTVTHGSSNLATKGGNKKK